MLQTNPKKVHQIVSSTLEKSENLLIKFCRFIKTTEGLKCAQLRQDPKCLIPLNRRRVLISSGLSKGEEETKEVNWTWIDDDQESDEILGLPSECPKIWKIWIQQTAALIDVSVTIVTPIHFPNCRTVLQPSSASQL